MSDINEFREFTLREMMVLASRSDNEMWCGILAGETEQQIAVRIVEAMRIKGEMQQKAHEIYAEILGEIENAEIVEAMRIKGEMQQKAHEICAEILDEIENAETKGDEK